MQTWRITPQGGTRHHVQASLAGVIGAMGDAGFAGAALASVNGALNAASWSVYRVWNDRAPVLHLSSSHGVQDTTRDCFQAYADGLYRRDRTFDAARACATSGNALMLRLSAREFPNPEHREAIYRRHGVSERLSIAEPQADGSVLAVNLYHHDHQGAFADGELENFEHLAVGLLATVRRHIALVDTAKPARPNLAQLREALLQRCQAMPARELDVCARLLQGLSYDGIAADLGLSAATVKTYRRRAFERMGLHFKSELFAAFVGRH
ncbi:MAG: helix-turn-helix transcriptional regulator [Cytophagales bacterium]|nr:helix-turn-helix transcriptional regulator [Rhizobacter sp.]